MQAEKLALFGGPAAVARAHPHEVWPPPAEPGELDRLARQRNLDIGIRGNAGPIGELETKFRDQLTPGRKHSIAFNSGTSAMLAALTGVGVGPGDVVVAPALTYHAAVSSATFLGAEVRFVDISIATRCMDPAALETALNERVKAVVVVHQWGRVAAMDELLAITRRAGVPVIEDCSHAHGSSTGGRKAGTFGDVAIFSLQTNKAVFAGEGGILVTDSDAVADRAILTGHYRDRSKADVADPGLRAYWESGFGLKLRMSPFNAIVALASLDRFDDLAGARQTALKYLNDGLSPGGLLDPLDVPEPVAEMGAWYGFKPLCNADAQEQVGRTALVEALQAEGVEVDAPSGRALPHLPLFNGGGPIWSKDHVPEFEIVEGEIRQQFPQACAVEAAALSLPTFYVWPEDRETIDQYLLAFDKVYRNLDRLADRRTRTTATAVGLPRDAAGNGR